jgi:Gpi18-like mannosyltransferase
MVPAAIAGRPWGELLGIYGNQVAMFSRLSMNYPSIYTIITSDLDVPIRKLIIRGGTAATLMIFGCLAYYIYKKKFEITERYMITLVLFTAELCCFCLPVMHERYGYIPEILAVVYGLLSYKKMPICAALQVISMITYTRYLFGSTVTIMWPLTVAMLTVILVVGYDLYQQMNEPKKAVVSANKPVKKAGGK